MGAYTRVLAAIGLAGAAALGAVACEPGTGGGLSAMAVSFTTDAAGTRALERAGVQVRWLSCTTTLSTGRTASPPAPGVATVACEGETDEAGAAGTGRKITINGKVTQEIDGRCVRGDLKAEAGGRTVFHVGVLGDCSAPTPTRVPGAPTRVPGGDGPPRPTVTVTVTVTETRTPGK
ncbi:hypothetical protein ACWGI8_08000 [Streptomyces sp. NPDC054841]